MDAAAGGAPLRRMLRSGLVAMGRGDMLRQIHGVVQHAADAYNIGLQRAVEQEMPRLSHTRRGRDARPAMPKMKGADALPDFETRGAAEAKRIDCDVAKTSGEQRFVAKPGCFAECLFRSREDGDDVAFGDFREPDERQDYAPDFEAAPDLPGCVATGGTAREAEDAMREAIRFHIDGLIEDGLPVPQAQSTLAYVDA